MSEITYPDIGIVMGSQTDWKFMKKASEILTALDIQHENRIVSAHRTPRRLFTYGTDARNRRLKVIIAGAGGAAHLPGMLAAMTEVPVLGVPIPSTILQGQDSLHSIVQMPLGTPVGTMAIGVPGAGNAALFAAKILALTDHDLQDRLVKWHDEHCRIPEVPVEHSQEERDHG